MSRYLLALCAALAAGQAAAQANSNCAPRAVVVDRLASQFGESRQSMGLGSNNQVVEIFASTETGSWTIVVSTAAGMSCVVAAGQAFVALAETLPPPGEDM